MAKRYVKSAQELEWERNEAALLDEWREWDESVHGEAKAEFFAEAQAAVQSVWDKVGS